MILNMDSEVANITYLFDQRNYGQRLQCYALQRFVRREFGVEMYTLDTRVGVDYGDSRYFHAFENECLNIIGRGRGSFGKLDGFERVIIGGDQVLNWHWGYDEFVRSLVDGWKPGHRNVAFYSAGLAPDRSIRGSFLRAMVDRVVAYGLRERPSNFQDFVQNIDPVFLLRDEWRDFSVRVEGIESDVSEFMYRVDKGCCSQLSVSTEDDKFDFDCGEHPIDPRQFVWLLSKSRRVVTNSFHGFAFAVMMEVPEIKVDDPTDMRITSLVDLLGIRMDWSAGVVLNRQDVKDRIASEVDRARKYLSAVLLCDPHIQILAYAKDQRIRNACSSGGFLAVAARSFYEKGGVVYGGAFSSDFRSVECVRTSCMDEYMSKLSGSKYNFCSLPEMGDLRSDLESGRPVMLIASPCHVEAVGRLLGREYDNLTLVAFRCRGYSSAKKLKSLVDECESKIEKNVASISFRKGHGFSLDVTLDDGTRADVQTDMWRQFVYDSLPMCRKCQFGHGMFPVADIVTGDAWCNDGNCLGLGQEFTPSKGCNIVEANSEKGSKLLDELKPMLKYVMI